MSLSVGSPCILVYMYTYIKVCIPVVPGQAGGGSFQKEKNYIAQK